MDANHNLDGHLGQGMEVKGTLRFEGSVRIDGKFTGKVVSPATLILGPSALVDGEGRLVGLVSRADLIATLAKAHRTHHAEQTEAEGSDV